MNELKCCPFCNKTNIEFKFKATSFYPTIHKDYFECDNCGTHGPCVFINDEDSSGIRYEKCLKIWNDRK